MLNCDILFKLIQSGSAWYCLFLQLGLLEFILPGFSTTWIAKISALVPTVVKTVTAVPVCPFVFVCFAFDFST